MATLCRQPLVRRIGSTLSRPLRQYCALEPSALGGGTKSGTKGHVKDSAIEPLGASTPVIRKAEKEATGPAVKHWDASNTDKFDAVHKRIMTGFSELKTEIEATSEDFANNIESMTRRIERHFEHSFKEYKEYLDRRDAWMLPRLVAATWGGMGLGMLSMYLNGTLVIG